MKYIFSLLIILFSFAAKSQTIHFDSSAQFAYVNIAPVKASFNDSVSCTRLYVRIFNDNLNSECTLYWELRDELGRMYKRGNGKIAGEDYQDWEGDNRFPFTFEADALGLDITQ